MANNVISCKKSKETLKKSKSLILQCNFGSRAQKWPKIAKTTDHSIAIFSIFFYRYGIFWMPPGESSHPGGSEYVWQRGVEGVLGWVTGSRSWPYFPKKTQLKWAVQKNKHGHNFQNTASKLNQHGLIVYETTLIQFGSDILKIVAVWIFFWRLILIGFYFKIGSTSAARNSS